MYELCACGHSMDIIHIVRRKSNDIEWININFRNLSFFYFSSSSFWIQLTISLKEEAESWPMICWTINSSKPIMAIGWRIWAMFTRTSFRTRRQFSSTISQLCRSAASYRHAAFSWKVAGRNAELWRQIPAHSRIQSHLSKREAKDLLTGTGHHTSELDRGKIWWDQDGYGKDYFAEKCTQKI